MSKYRIVEKINGFHAQRFFETRIKCTLFSCKDVPYNQWHTMDMRGDEWEVPKGSRPIPSIAVFVSQKKAAKFIEKIKHFEENPSVIVANFE